MRLYHRTDKAAALAIMDTREWASRENTNDVYFSTEIEGQGEGYGDIVLAVEVSPDVAVLDDEFPGGEQHYRVPASALSGLPVEEIGHHRRAAMRRIVLQDNRADIALTPEQSAGIDAAARGGRS